MHGKVTFHTIVQFMYHNPASPLISVGKTVDAVETFCILNCKHLICMRSSAFNSPQKMVRQRLALPQSFCFVFRNCRRRQSCNGRNLLTGFWEFPCFIFNRHPMLLTCLFSDV